VDGDGVAAHHRQLDLVHVADLVGLGAVLLRDRLEVSGVACAASAPRRRREVLSLRVD
jgi:hypothetical protein